MSEAIRFALFAAWPDDAFGDWCWSVVGVPVGSPAWAGEQRAAFAVQCAFNARVLDVG